MERALVFQAGGEDLLGILHEGASGAARGVLVVVGGPQYRVGSHRQFLLLARRLAAAGIPVFRFDYRGMGDAGGAQRDFEQVEDDIRAAIDTFTAHAPGLREVVVWGLCDAASAALSYAAGDSRVGGLVLLNPWVRTEQGLAKARLKHYYLRRIASRDFWSGLLGGRLNPLASARSVLATMAGARGKASQPPSHSESAQAAPAGTLPERMAEGWKRFRGGILLILSGDDLTAAEFRDAVATVPAWRGLLDEARVYLRELPAANHTFSRQAWRDQVAEWTLDWVAGAPGDAKRAVGP